ncbi:MAG: fused MFS/spermidine synthase [Elusimicrobiota bacterium]
MMFFQGMLVAGYIYVRVALIRLSASQSAKAQLALLFAAALTLPVSINGLPAVSDPALRLLAALLMGAGLPFFVLFSTTPLIQSWLERRAEYRRDGYHLFAASNAGALAALAAYPILLEPLFRLKTLLAIWAGLYIVFAALHLFCLPAGQRNLSNEPRGRIPARLRLLWVLASAGPCAAMLAATNLLTHDFAAIPLLWILPLGIYLATFILNFKKKRWYPGRLNLLFVTLLGTCFALFLIPALRELMKVLGKFFFIAGGLFMIGMICHRALADTRPPGGRAMPGFYVWVAIGGWLGSAIIGVGLPWAARHVAIVSLDWLAAAMLCVAALAVRDWGKRRTAAMLALLAAAFAGAIVTSARTADGASERIYSLRNFYGVYSVEEKGGLRALYHGNTLHGMQFTGGRSTMPLSYFHPRSGLGDVFRLLGEGRRSIGAVGLGTGAVAAYCRRGQTLDFYELDPDVERIARGHFTYLSDSAADIRVVLGDARMRLADRREAAYDLLVLDAFNSGAVPVHLLTREALKLYRSRLTEEGLIAMHISNRYLDLAPLISGLARELGFYGAVTELKSEKAAPEKGLTPSRWAVLSRDRSAVRLLEEAGWQALPAPPASSRIWTDQRASLLPYLSF